MESRKKGKRGYYDDDDEDGFKQEFVKPDRSKSDYYCILCDSHMNSLQMWESHISGKRHLTNLKKKPGERPSKIKTVKQDNVTPLIQKRLDDIRHAVVGLSYVTEFRRSDSSAAPLYTCYLCTATTTKSEIIDHLLSSKHQANFLKEVDPESYDLLEGLQLGKSAKETLIDEKAMAWAATHERGRIEVRLDKPKATYWESNKRKNIESSSSPPAKRMHDGAQRDLPGPSSGSRTSTASTSQVSEPEFDMDEICGQLSYDTKLEMLGYMIPRIVVKSDDDARALRHIINCFLQLGMQYRIRQLSQDQQTSLARDVLSDSLPTVDEGLAEVIEHTHLLKHGKFRPDS